MALFETLSVRYMRDLMRDFSLPDFQAAGICGNGGAESGGFEKVQEINPTVKGSAGGLGHFQWTGRTAKNRRRLNFEEWIARNADKGWTPRTYEANYSMLFRELKGPEKAALTALKRTTTLEQATRVFCEKFERPGIVHMDSRIRWAQRAMAAWKAAEGKPVPAPEPAPKPASQKPSIPAPAKQDLGAAGILTAIGAAIAVAWTWFLEYLPEIMLGLVALIAVGAIVFRLMKGHWPWTSPKLTGDQSQVPSPPLPPKSEASLEQLSHHLEQLSVLSPGASSPTSSASLRPRKRSAKRSPKTRKRRKN